MRNIFLGLLAIVFFAACTKQSEDFQLQQTISGADIGFTPVDTIVTKEQCLKDGGTWSPIHGCTPGDGGVLPRQYTTIKYKGSVLYSGYPIQVYYNFEYGVLSLLDYNNNLRPLREPVGIIGVGDECPDTYKDDGNDNWGIGECKDGLTMEESDGGDTVDIVPCTCN